MYIFSSIDASCESMEKCVQRPPLNWQTVKDIFSAVFEATVDTVTTSFRSIRLQDGVKSDDHSNHVIPLVNAFEVLVISNLKSNGNSPCCVVCQRATTQQSNQLCLMAQIFKTKLQYSFSERCSCTTKLILLSGRLLHRALELYQIGNSTSVA